MAGVEVEDAPAEASEVFGDSWELAQAYARMLVDQGELRGLIGPRELPRLWSRHILNSTAVARFLPDGAAVADVGSGAGFPGVVLAVMRPDIEMNLIEPMERRVEWLHDVVHALDLQNVTVRRARAEEVDEEFDAVTARAVAALRKLVPWVGPLVAPGGRLLALKGERAAVEIDEAQKVLRRARLVNVRVHEVLVPGTDEPTRVVEAEKRPSST